MNTKMFLSLLAAGSFCVVAPSQAQQSETGKTAGAQGTTKQSSGKANKQGAATTNKAAAKTGKAATTKSASEQRLEVVLGSMGVSPTKLNASAGSIVLEITNNSDKPHKMVLEGGTMKKVSADVAVGGTGKLTGDFDAGNYTLRCQMGGHMESGAKLTIQ